MDAAGMLPAIHESPVMPAEFTYLMPHFEDLHDGRRWTGGGMGIVPLAISHEEIRAYMRNFRIRLSPWQIRMIRRMDHTWRWVWSVKHAPKGD